jgi:hypothetical protein
LLGPDFRFHTRINPTARWSSKMRTILTMVSPPPNLFLAIRSW